MLYISRSVHQKLMQKHGLTDPEMEILEAFSNRTGSFLLDTREDHQSDPPTEWFISETNRGVLLKICFICKEGEVHIRTAYQPNVEEIRLYEKYK